MSDLARTALERIGQFYDGPYDTTVTLYRPDIQKLMGRDDTPKDDPLRLDGPFPRIPGHKLKAATNDWTFSPFATLWDGEPYQAEKPKGHSEDEGKPPFVAAVAERSMNGLGTYYGTFISHMDAFSPEKVVKKDPLDALPNIVTKPGKKGTGYGYANVALSPYPIHLEDPYPFDPKKKVKKGVNPGDKDSDKATWKPTGAQHLDYFDPNPFKDSKDPDGMKETYDYSWMDKKKGDKNDRAAWKPSDGHKCINGNKDVIKPLDRFPSYDPSDPYKTTNLQTSFRSTVVDPEKPSWKPQFGNRSMNSRSVIQYNTKIHVNSTNFHLH